MRQQISQVQAVVIIIHRYPGQHIGQPFPGINSAGFAAAQQGIHDGCIFSRLMVAAEHEVFPA